MRRTALVLVCAALTFALSGCLSFVQEGGLFGDVVSTDESIEIVVVHPNAEAPLNDPYPLFVGAEWVYRNATTDFNPEVHPTGLLSNRVLANVYCIDSSNGDAWECFAVRATDYRNSDSIEYLHRSDDGIYRFSSVLREQSHMFPGYLFLPKPLLQDTYMVYNVPKFENGVLWDRAVGCSGDRNLLNIGGQGDCAVGSEVVALTVVYRPEMVGLTTIVDSVLGGYTTIFANSWKLELYNGINEYPEYQWWSHSPDLAWLAPGVGVVKCVKGSSSLELMEFVHSSEILSLSPAAESRWYDCVEGGQVVLQFRGTDPEGANPTTWRIAAIGGLTPNNESAPVVEQIGERAFYNDIDTSGRRLDTGTYVYIFKSARKGYATLQFESNSNDESPEQSLFRIRVGDFNSPPIAQDDQFVILGNSGEIELAVLENDFEIDPTDRIRIHQITTLPSHGAIRIADGKVLYTPDQDDLGWDMFRYSIEDRKGSTAEATVRVRTIEAEG
jgi:Bacterial Ig domain